MIGDWKVEILNCKSIIDRFWKIIEKKLIDTFKY